MESGETENDNKAKKRKGEKERSRQGFSAFHVLACITSFVASFFSKTREIPIKIINKMQTGVLSLSLVHSLTPLPDRQDRRTHTPFFNYYHYLFVLTRFSLFLFFLLRFCARFLGLLFSSRSIFLARYR